LAASVVATGAGAAALGYSEGAWGADGSSAAAVTADTAPSTTPSTTTTDSPTTAEVTEPAEVTAASGYTDGVYLGSAEYTEWGDVQVQVTIGDGGIVDVAAVQYPTGRKSSNINAQALPMLEADAIAMQSADLDIVSGATYTSRTYADSLQAALDQAALAASQDEGSS
jgi:uncharacterized protein with FMN-binding domain